MNDKPEIKPKGITPLKHICMTIGELPSSYLETMTYYEMLLWFTKFLQERMIPTLDNNALAVEELQKLFIELRNYVNNYFDNLDVQDEINNKLDQMLEDGVLEQIIEQFLQSTALWCFDTVEDMQDATNLINGSYAKTLGYYTENDGGGTTYKIRTKTNDDIIDECFILSLTDTSLVAELIIDKKTVSTNQCGIFGDNETDVTNKLNIFFSNTNINNYIINGGTYIISDNINIMSDSTINGIGDAIIKFVENTDDYFIINILNKKNININNLKLIGNRQTHSSATYASGFGFNVMFSQNIVIKDCIAQDLWCDGFYVGNSFTEEQELITNHIYIDNCQSIQCQRNGFVVSGGKNITLNNCYAYNSTTQPGCGIDIEPEGSNSIDLYVENVKINNFTSESCEIGLSLYARNTYIKNCKIINHLSINDNKGETINLGNGEGNSNVDFIGSNIVNSRDYGCFIYACKSPNTLLIKDLIVDGCSESAPSTSINKGCLLLYGLNNDEDTLANITIDNIRYKNTNSSYDYYFLISQQHYHLSSVLLKNTIRETNSPKIAIYNNDKITIENCIIKDNESSTLGRYNIFNFYQYDTLISAIRNIQINDLIPDGIYELINTNNTSGVTAGFQFNNNLTVYYNENVINNLVYTYNIMGHCKFLKKGSKILILETTMRTTNS